MATARTHWTESAVFAQLRHIFPSPAHVRIAQVRNGTGYSRAKTRTADAIVLSVWPSRGLWMAGVEIKVSRADWKKELAQPDKSAEIQGYCDYWYVACPRGVIEQAVVPETWGLIEVDGTTAEIARCAPRLTPKPIDMALLCSILRAVEEATVPVDVVQDKISERVKEAMEGEKRRLDYEHSAQREAVEAFEQASGVSIGMRWDAGDIGKAVRFVRESGVMKCRSTMERLAKEAERIAAWARKALEEFDSPATGEGTE